MRGAKRGEQGRDGWMKGWWMGEAGNEVEQIVDKRGGDGKDKWVDRWAVRVDK